MIGAFLVLALRLIDGGATEGAGTRQPQDAPRGQGPARGVLDVVRAGGALSSLGGGRGGRADGFSRGGSTFLNASEAQKCEMCG